jgi:alpha-L-fucosidase 2
MPAVLTYMLVQSTTEEIELLPALPLQWQEGSLKGALTRCGYIVDFVWKKGKPVKAKFKSLKGNKTKIKYRDKYWNIDALKGETVEIDFQ